MRSKLLEIEQRIELLEDLCSEIEYNDPECFEEDETWIEMQIEKNSWVNYLSTLLDGE